MKNAPFRFNPTDWFAFFAERGWRAGQVRYLPQESERLGRPAPMSLLARLLSVFIPKAKLEKFRRFTAYVMLEQA